MKRLFIIAALLLAGASAAAAETDQEALDKRAVKVANKHRVCVCAVSGYYGRMGYLQTQSGAAPSAWCYAPSFDAFGKANGGVDCFAFTVLP